METELIEAYYVPESIKLTDFRQESIQVKGRKYIVKYPELTAEHIEEIGASLQANRKDYLAQLTTNEVVDKIDQAIQLWLNPNYRLRRIADALIPAVTGYDQDMVRLELKRYMRTFRKKELLRFLDEEFDQPAILDDFRPRKSGGMSRAYGPNTIFHLFSGNVPGVQLWSLIMGLLLKSAAIGKTSYSEPLLPALFLQSLKEVDERLADAIAILPWKGGQSPLIIWQSIGERL